MLLTWQALAVAWLDRYTLCKAADRRLLVEPMISAAFRRSCVGILVISSTRSGVSGLSQRISSIT